MNGLTISELRQEVVTVRDRLREAHQSFISLQGRMDSALGGFEHRVYLAEVTLEAQESRIEREVSRAQEREQRLEKELADIRGAVQALVVEQRQLREAPPIIREITHEVAAGPPGVTEPQVREFVRREIDAAQHHFQANFQGLVSAEQLEEFRELFNQSIRRLEARVLDMPQPPPPPVPVWDAGSRRGPASEEAPSFAPLPRFEVQRAASVARETPPEDGNREAFQIPLPVPVHDQQIPSRVSASLRRRLEADTDGRILLAMYDRGHKFAPHLW